MRFRSRTWFLLSLLLFVAAYWFWRYGEKINASRRAQASHAAAVQGIQPSTPGTAKIVQARNTVKNKSYRLSNTHQTEKQLLGNNHAIILRNALIDTQRPLNLDIPARLRAKGAPGSYIVQSDGPMDQQFYDRLKQIGATYMSYIPNNAALVQATPDQAKKLAGDAMFQAVLPFEPYYKLALNLLPAAVDDQQPPSAALNVTTFPGQRNAALAALQALGAQLMAEDSSPFGPTLTVMVPPNQLDAVAQLPLAREIEAYAPRRMLNDLTRPAMGISDNSLYVTPNYLDLTGSNVTVNLNDSGVDSTHPDFLGQDGSTRLEGTTNALYDYEGHGTHIAGIIMGNGSRSYTVTKRVPGSIIPGAGFQGKATNANLFVQSLGLVIGTTVAGAYQGGGNYVSDLTLQTNTSVGLGPTNLISNNSWGYDGVTSYDMHAASYDQATRDAQPGLAGEQPLLFVFAAGDGNTNGNGGGVESSIVSPATAKNVITVGAIDSPRFITNAVTFDGATTNAIFYPWTDNNDLVSWFSSDGNVSPGTEGLSGRFKPDVVAPGMFIISCRATNYVDPTNATEITPYPFVGQVVQPGQINPYALPLIPSNFPADTEELVVEATPNGQSPVPFPSLLILGAPSGQALQVLGTNTIAQSGTNFVVLNENFAGQAWNFGVSTTNGQIQPVNYDLTFYLVETNDLGVAVTNANGYYNVISNLNSVLKPYYVYQYGTSMSAGAVSGMLALMQEFLQSRMGVTNPAPALLKAMLINGSRSINQQYDFNTQLVTSQAGGANEQGWGLPNLPNTLPPSLTNTSGNSTSMILVNQSTNIALATGQWESYTVNCADPNATNFPIRVTLVWTDPPGDPAAGIALVNNLDLVVTSGSGTNAQIWLGNDFLSGEIYTTNNSGDAPDFINNVQNVYIDNTNAQTLFPLTVTVLGARVNVNAATTQTNQIAQDYALVISSDDPALTASLQVTSNGVSGGPLTILSPYQSMANSLGLPLLTWPLTGFLQGTSNFVTIVSNGVPLLDQRVGANEPNLYANGPLYTSTDTNGNVAQWHFFVFTNNQITSSNQATNVAFATFLPPNLATQIAPRTNGADLDLYVSTNPGLTNLDPAVFAAMTSNDMSLTRSGTETVIYSNSQPNEVYYIGIKSEDQQAADFGFYAVAQQAPFGINNPDGSITYNASALPVTIPDDQFGVPPARVLAIAGRQMAGRTIRKVTVNVTINHANPGDLTGILQPEQTTQVVLNNFTGTNVGEIFTNYYNDLDDGFGGGHTDGPGSLQNYMSQPIPPLWMLQETDNSAFQGGQITSFSVTVSPQPLLGPIVITLAPGQTYFDYVNVPTDAIYLTNAVTLQSGSTTSGLGIYMTNMNNVTQSDADGTNLTFNSGGLQIPGGYLLVGTNSPEPLNGGIWYYGIFNDGDTTVTFTNEIFFDYNFVPNLVQAYTNTTPINLTTDGTTNSTQICINSGQQVIDLSVGVRLSDTNLDNLALQLTSPQGTSILLFENRGGVLATNLGLTLTNGPSSNSYVYTTFTEDTNLSDEPIKFGAPPYALAVPNPAVLIYSNGFEGIPDGTYTGGQSVAGWLVESNTEVSVASEPNLAYDSTNYVALASGRLSRTFATVPGTAYEFRYYARSPGLTDWWPADDNTVDLVGTNNGVVTGLVYDVGEVARAFTFNGTNSEVTFGTNAGNFGTNDFSIDFWIKTSNTNESAIFEKRLACNDNQSLFSFRLNAPAAIGSGVWANTGSLHAARYNHTATLLTNGVVLVEGGWDNNYLGSAELYYPESESWTPTGSMNVPRVSQVASLLTNGEVLVAGGQNGSPLSTASSELYNPSSQTWSVTGSLNTPREYHTLTLLPNGLILAAGGWNGNVNGGAGQNLSSAEIYNLQTGIWTNTGSLHNVRQSHTATLLPNGMVLAAGGYNGNAITSAELYNPATGTWNNTGSLNDARLNHTATLLANGMVLVAGGQSPLGTALTTAELYNPASGTWTVTGSLKTARYYHTASLLPNGWVLVVGGLNNGSALAQSELYNPCSGTWTTTSSLKTARYDHTETLLPNGKVLVSAGENQGASLSSAELYNATGFSGIVYEQSSANGINYVQVADKTDIADDRYHHVTMTRDGQQVSLYLDGVLSSATTCGSGIANISNNVNLIAGLSACDGVDGTLPFKGDLDEPDLWNRALTPAEVYAIYRAGSSGKYSTNSLYPNFQLDVDGISTNTLIITNFDATNWIAYTNSFVATSNQTTIELAGNPLGVLLDDIALVQLAYTNFNNYYLPEEPLTPIIGQNPQGCWTLSIWDTRQDSPLPTNGTLLGWTLQLTTSSTNVNLIVLTNGVPYHETANAGITYFGVDVPLTANYATNTLLKAQGPMTLLFNQDALPTGGLPGDFTLFTLNGPQTDSATLTTEGVPPQLIPGQRYFLGVRNDGTAPEAFGLEVDFDVSTNTSGIFPLKNGIPLTKSVGANGPEFYSFFVPTNAVMASFQLLSPTNGQADLFARASLPVPGPLSFDYESANAGANDQFIVITTNSMPVPLQKAPVNDVLPISPTTWYLSVYNFAGTGNVGYTILATYITNGAMNIINLNNQSNYTAYQTNAPGFPTNLLYSFTVTNTNVAALQFTVTNISDNGDLQLLVGDGVFPTPEDFYIGSFNPGAANQTVTIVTNTVMTSLSNIWYAAVPNVSTNHAVVSYSITAAVSTNVMIAIPLFIGASIASPTNGFTMYWSAIPGTTYQIQVSTNLNSWAAVTNITPQTTTGSYTDAVPVISQTSRFFRIVPP